MDTGVTVAIIAGVTTLLSTTIAGYYALKNKRAEYEIKNQKNEIETAKEDVSRLKAELSCINIMFEHDLISFLNHQVDKLFERTKAERFIILFAINGKTEFNFVSVCYEKTKSDKTRGAIYRYVRLGIDSHYKEMLKRVERYETIYLDVDQMEESLLKGIYKQTVEGVTFSSIHFIKRLAADRNNDIVIYSSLATTKPEDFTAVERVTIKSTYDQIRAHSQNLTFSMG